MNRGSLKAGIAEVELKPALGYAMGDGSPAAKGFLTPLFVKALVLDNGASKLAVVTLDTMGIDHADANRIAAQVEQKCGIPADAVLLTCSHTHVAPSDNPTLHTYRQTFHASFDDAAKAREKEWIDILVGSAIQAVCNAAVSCESGASIGIVEASLPWLVFNRRYTTRNFGSWTQWMGVPKDQINGVEGPIDPQFNLIVIRNRDYKPMAMLWNFTGHNSFHFGDQYSADLAYTVQKALDERIGKHVPCLYLPGCSGNTNYFDYSMEFGLEKATEGVASAIMAIYRDACTLPEIVLNAARVELMFAQRDTTRNWWKSDIKTKLPGWDEKNYGQIEADRFQNEGKQAYRANVVALQLGHIGLVGLPGEIFVEFGMMIKERSPFRHTCVASYSNGYAGYVATRRAFIGGSYAVWPVLNARIARDGGYLMVDKSIELLNSFVS